MDTKQPTPEEKLFAVIQGAAHPPIRSRTQTLTLAGMGTWVQVFLATLDLPRINQGLVFVIGGLILWCVLTPLMMRTRLDQVVAQVRQQAPPFTIGPPLQGLKTLEAYTETMHQKDPFRVEPPPVVSPPTVETSPTPPPPPDFHGALANLKLVGISWGPDPTAMIEETDTKQTHFLKVGNTVGPFTIKEVRPDRILLHAGDQELELF